MSELEQRLVEGQRYRDGVLERSVEIEQIFVSKDGDAKVRCRVFNTLREDDEAILDKETVVGYIVEKEWELSQEPEYRRD